MSEDAVVLRLTGSTRGGSLESWVQALGTVPASSRALRYDGDALPPDVAEQCAEARITVLDGDGGDVGDVTPDVLVVARADGLPTPRALRRLVDATRGGEVAHHPRVLPCGPVAGSTDGATVAPWTPCVAVPRTAAGLVASSRTPDEARAALTAAGVDVRLLDASAVVARHWPPDRDAGPVPTDAPGPVVDAHPAAMPATSLHQLMVRAAMTPPDTPTPAPASDRPFLTVLTRTRGTRLLLLEETLTCLASQTSRDFDVVVVRHRAEPAGSRAVRELVGELPRWLADRIRVVDCERPGRAAPINDALAHADGRYVAVLDDDDTVTDDWVAAFARLAASHAGTVLRAATLRQDVEPAAGADGDVVAREVGPARPGWPLGFSLVEHLQDNASPFMSLAFPRSVFTDLGVRFEETLDATEDWDVLLQAATLVGVTSTPRLTSVYRTWTRAEGSREAHDAEVWSAAHRSVVERLDAVPLLAPPGTVGEVRALHRALAEERAEKFRFAGLNEQAAADLRAVNEAVVVLRERVAQLEERLARVRRRRQPG